MFEGIYSWIGQILVFHFCVVYTISSIFLYSLTRCFPLSWQSLRACC